MDDQLVYIVYYADQSAPTELLKAFSSDRRAADRSVGLTPEEKIERQQLREAYLKDFRAGLRDQIEHTQVFDKKGKELTSKKVQKIQREHGWRKD